MATPVAQVIAVELQVWDASRINLLTNPRTWGTVSGWGNKLNVSVTDNAATGADNLVLADKLFETAVNSNHYVDADTITTPSNVNHTASFYVKAAGRTELRLELFSGAAFAETMRVTYDLATGTIPAVADFGTGSLTAYGIQAHDNGWFRCWVTFIPESGTSNQLKLRFRIMNAGASSYLGDGSSGFFFDRPLVEIGTALRPFVDSGPAPGAGITTLYFSNTAYTTNGAAIPPHTSFDSRVIEAPNFSRQAFSDFRILGGGSGSAGVLELANADHALAPLMDYGVVGRSIIVRLGSPTAAYPSGFTTWLTGTVELVEVTIEKAVIRIRDRQYLLEQPIQSSYYAGNNTGSGGSMSGAEGVADDISGLPKPSLWGRAYHAAPTLINSGKQIYQLHSGTISAIDAVYDKGTLLTYGGSNHANLAALEAASITANQYHTCLALGLFRLGGSPSGRVTADARGDNSGSGYVDRVGAIVRRILEARCGIATADLNTASFTALDAAANYEVGIFINSEMTARQAVDQLLVSVGGWIAPDATGIWKVGQLVAPSGTPDFTVTDDHIISIDRVATGDVTRGVPVYRVELKYKPFWTVFTLNDLAAGVSDANKSMFIQPWRTSATSDAPTFAANPKAAKMIISTLINSVTDANTERDRQLALHKVSRHYVKLRLHATSTFLGIDIGKIIEVKTVALGYSAGRKFFVRSVTRQGQVLDIDMWG